LRIDSGNFHTKKEKWLSLIGELKNMRRKNQKGSEDRGTYIASQMGRHRKCGDGASKTGTAKFHDESLSTRV
jgi:hypothetical protein